MYWEKFDKGAGMRIPVKSWCRTVEPDALKQAVNLASHPKTVGHVALMPDCHVVYGMPIGGVIACDGAVIPNAVGVDIGCGMVAVETDQPVELLKNKSEIRRLLDLVKTRVPVGEGQHHKQAQEWNGFDDYLGALDGARPPWFDPDRWNHDKKNLGTLGGGNHFIELQEGDTGKLWLMVHSGSRNLGYRIAEHYHKKAVDICSGRPLKLPDKDLAFLECSSVQGRNYIRDMSFALQYALENRRRMMSVFKESLGAVLRNARFVREVNIHHNFASLEKYDGREVWIHRKGATSARKGETGIIPGSMGTASYIVEGLGNSESFRSCSHGAGRTMSRIEACRRLTREQCDAAMGDVVYDRWNRLQHRGNKNKGLLDLAEAPPAYKDIGEVIEAELDLINPVVRLRPLGVVKG